MNTTIAGYHIKDQVYEGHHSLVYRGQEEEKSQFVILKLLKQGHPSPRQLAAFRHEYQLLCSLQLPGVIRA